MRNGKSAWHIGSLFGIPLFLDPSWFFIFILVTIVYSSEWRSYNVTDGFAWVVGVCMALLLFASVLMHELGHSLVAIAQGIRVRSITLFLFGGIAAIERESNTPKEAFQVAIAGPAVSFILFVGLTVSYTLLPLGEASTLVLERLASINLILTIFNMMPGLPLDGGQVLKSAIWQATGNRFQGIRWAARSGQLFGWGAIVTGICLYLTSFEPVLLWLAVIGWFGIRNAKGYARVAQIQEAMLTLRASDVMRREFRVVDSAMSVDQFVMQYLNHSNHSTGHNAEGTDTEVNSDEGKSAKTVYFVTANGQYRGQVDLLPLQTLERGQWSITTIGDIAIPFADMPSVRESSSLADVIQALDRHQLNYITVLSPADAVSGVINRRFITLCMMEQLKISFTSDELDSADDICGYPLSLPLSELAQTLRHD